MLLWIIIVPLGVYLLMALFLFFSQNRMAFSPSRAIDLQPDQIGLQSEEVWIELENGERLHGWYFPVAGSDKAVLLCHGNAGNISHRLETAQFLVEMGVNALLFDYRGYGRSDGSPSEANVYADAEAAYRWLIRKKSISPDKLYLFGRSLGGAVAIDLATRVPCGGVIVESSLTSAADLGKRMFPFMPIKLMLRYRFDSIGKIGTLGCPVLVTHSPEDEVIPYEMGKRLYEAARQPKQFVGLSGGHNERLYFNDEAYIQAVRGFLKLGQPGGYRPD